MLKFEIKIPDQLQFKMKAYTVVQTPPVPIASTDTLGNIMVGQNLKIDENGVLSVDTASSVEQDNTKPVTSGAVHAEIGNIEVLLAAL